eukprot:828299-Ditylum_brightwellii.AAC.1
MLPFLLFSLGNFPVQSLLSLQGNLCQVWMGGVITSTLLQHIAMDKELIKVSVEYHAFLLASHVQSTHCQ